MNSADNLFDKHRNPLKETYHFYLGLYILLRRGGL